MFLLYLRKEGKKNKHIYLFWCFVEETLLQERERHKR